MIVFDLKCRDGHVFEAWFANSKAFEDQKGQGLLACPLCGAAEVDKAVMAPNVAAKGNQRAAAPLPAQTKAEPAPAEVKALLETLAKAQAALLEKSEWVGQDFASKARAMDAGEIDASLIHGQTTPQEAKALIEEGIGVLPLPFPVVPPEKQN
ncbi:MAG: DUF1178 family protein [Chakrabartia sp.]